MRIVVVGGIPVSLVRFRGAMIRSMVDLGHEVHAVAGGESPETERELASMGVAYHGVRLGRTGLNPIQDLGTLLDLRRLFRRLAPDLSLAYTIKPVVYGTLAAAWAGVPHRHAMITGLGSSLQGSGFPMGMLSRIAGSLYRFALARAEGVFFQNPDNLAFFRERGLLADGCRTTLIHGSGVDLAHYAPCPLPDGPLTFLFVGRLVKDKGVREYAEAARLVKARHPRAKCLLVGPLDSNPTAVSAAWVAHLEKEGILDYCGLVPDIREVLRDSHVLVLPSYGEGTPRSVLEAMAMGRAILTTEAPGCRETVQEGCNGFLVPVQDPLALADRMERFILDPDLVHRMGAQSLALARERYDVHKVNRVIFEALGLLNEG